ncbi:MAG: hypothetical protein KDC98_24360 [Planctomycetes bacterium]|nr:hypothetical protein [Planctomycetota bacterium]
MPANGFWQWLRKARRRVDTPPPDPRPGPLPAPIEDALTDALGAGTLWQTGVVDELCARHPSWTEQIESTVAALLALGAATAGSDAVGDAQSGGERDQV